MKFLDIFSGIGGFRIGMEMAGHECVGHIEWDKFAQRSYMAMHDVKESEFIGWDIKKVRADELPRADCWCFGFPCQDISIAGKQEGFAGHRSSLFFAVTRLIRDLEEENRPSILFVENVKNLLSVNRGGDFLKLLIELDEIGYDAEWQLLNSKHFGVPQNRERVFIVGHLRGRGGRKVFPIRETNESIGNEIKRLAHSKYFRRVLQTFDVNGSCEALDTMQGRNRQPCVKVLGNVNPSGNGMNGNVLNIEGLAPTLTTNKGEGNKIAIPVLTPDRAEKRQNGRRFKEDGEPMFTLTAQDRHGVAIYQRSRGNNRGGLHEIAPTLSSNSYEHNNHVCDFRDIDWNMDKFAEMMTSPPNPSKELAEYAKKNDFRIRRLTPRECFRLQGVSDEYFERAAAVNSDSQLYKQAGNGVTVNVIYEIAKRL